MCVCVCVCTSCTVLAGGEAAEEEGAAEGRRGAPAPGWGPLRRCLRSLPPQLDPVVKAKRERGRLGPPGSLQEEAGAGKEGSRGRRGEAGRQGCEPSADLSSAS